MFSYIFDLFSRMINCNWGAVARICFDTSLPGRGYGVNFWNWLCPPPFIIFEMVWSVIFQPQQSGNPPFLHCKTIWFCCFFYSKANPTKNLLPIHNKGVFFTLFFVFSGTTFFWLLHFAFCLNKKSARESGMWFWKY